MLIITNNINADHHHQYHHNNDLPVIPQFSYALHCDGGSIYSLPSLASFKGLTRRGARIRRDDQWQWLTFHSHVAHNSKAPTSNGIVLQRKYCYSTESPWQRLNFHSHTFRRQNPKPCWFKNSDFYMFPERWSENDYFLMINHILPGKWNWIIVGKSQMRGDVMHLYCCARIS